MKHNRLFIALLAMAALAATACTKTQNGTGPDLDPEKLDNQYVSFRIASPESPATKADYSNGTAEESAVYNAWFFFYRNGNFVTRGQVNDLEDETIWQQTAGGPVAANTKQAVVMLESNGVHPTEVVVLMNISKETADRFANHKTLDAALAEMQDTDSKFGNPSNFGITGSDGKFYFTMANSSYYDTANGTPSVVQAYPIPHNAICYDPKDAMANPVNIYVERIVAKVNVHTETVTLAQDIAANYDVVIRGWSLNSVNKNSFLVKHIDAAWPQNPKYTWTGNEASVPTDPAYFRTAWGRDPWYSTIEAPLDNYPVDNLDYHEDISPVHHYTQKNLWAKAITATDPADPAFDAAAWRQKTYCFENTFDETLSHKAKNVGTHVLVFAQFKTKGAADYDQNYFRYNGTVLARTDYLNRILTDVKTGYTFYVGADAAGSTAMAATDLEIVTARYENNGNGRFINRAGTNPSDFKVSAFPKQDLIGGTGDYAGKKLFYSQDNGTTKAEATSAVIEDAFGNYVLGLADLYENGWMVYFVPIKHVVPQTDPDETYLGEYGVVRNHFYDITLGEIKGLGFGIFDPADPNTPDQRVVPDDTDEKWFLSASVNINAWHLVSQTSDLVE
ncbi:MAG: Mfa1 fimbrilin C-terminal domain-containing protein [Bacteroidales bacterium]|nr:Mfa1 fimbrilin C-terminal domain-containing protein [Bacteroidales bacterium]